MEQDADHSLPGTDDDEARRLLDAARNHSARDHAIVALMMGAGLRVSEVAALPISRLVEGADGELLIHITGKGDKDRTVPCGADLAGIVKRHLAAEGRTLDQRDTDPLFTTKDNARRHRDYQALTPAAVDFRLRRLLAAADVEGKRVSCHSLRHTFAIRYLRSGGDLRVLQKLLGHSSIATTERYVDHLKLSDLTGTMPALPGAEHLHGRDRTGERRRGTNPPAPSWRPTSSTRRARGR